MSIQSTKYVSRAWAIARIIEVDSLAQSKNYRELEMISNETDANIRDFVDGHKPLDVDNLDKWTDGMLGDTLDEPFFRQSIFDNYIVSDDEEEDACS